MKKRERRFRLFSHRGDWIVLWVLAGLFAAILLVSALRQYAGLALIQGGLYLYLPLLMVLIALGWGMSAIFRRLKRPAVRGIVGTLMVLAMLGMLVIGMSYASFAAELSFPHRYIVIGAPDGVHKLTVLRMLDPDENRMEQRRAARLAENPDGADQIVAEDWGYIYTAYSTDPTGLFYKVNTCLEGEVHIGYGSAAELMVEWEDSNTVGHFFVKNPEIGDGGEMRALCDR